jgi:simple sugar transport system permease protein
MRLELVKRPERSKLFSAISPLIAFGLTVIAGAIMFSLLGINPFTALKTYFIEPITQVWQLHELAIKAAPLILIAVGLSVCYRSNVWNIGAEGQFIAGAVFGSILPILFPETVGWWVLPVMLVLGMAGGAAYAAVPAFLKARFNTNEILTSLMLVYVAQLVPRLAGARAVARPGRATTFRKASDSTFSAILARTLADVRATAGCIWGRCFAVIAVVVRWRFLLAKHAQGLRDQVCSDQAPRAGRFAGFSAVEPHGAVHLPASPVALAGLAWHLGSRRAPSAELLPSDLARLRLHCHHRCLPRPAEPDRHSWWRVWCWRSPILGGEGAQVGARHFRQDGRARVPGDAAVLRARLRHADQLPRSFRRHHHRAAGPGASQNAPGGGPLMDIAVNILLTIATAATPLLIAAIGELVVRALRRFEPRRRGHDDHGRGRRPSARLTQITGSPWMPASLAAIVIGALFSLLFAVHGADAG